MENDKTPTPSWKGCILFGIVNLVLVWLCTRLNILLISVAMMLLLLTGVVVSFQSVKEDWHKGFKLSAVGCVGGLLFHVVAGTLYVISILLGVTSPLLRILS